MVKAFFNRAAKLFSIILTLWFGGLLIFFFSLPLQVMDEKTPTQAIVALTGGSERLKTGFSLLCQKQANLIFISGVNPEENLRTILKSVPINKIDCPLDREQLTTSTHLGYQAKNTKGNAKETAAWVKQMNISSLRLVTASYHMPRSLMELRNLLPHITIIPHPVFSYGQDRLKWFENTVLLFTIFSEYNKFLWGYVRIHLPLSNS